MVTGANSGIGWHTALELARAGSDVITAARTDAKVRMSSKNPQSRPDPHRGGSELNGRKARLL